MHCVPGHWNFYALHVGYFVGARSDDFFDFIGSFLVCSKFSRVSFSGVLKDFTKDQISLIKSAIPYVGIIVLCGCVLVILDSDERSISALVNEIEIIQEHGIIDLLSFGKSSSLNTGELYFCGNHAFHSVHQSERGFFRYSPRVVRWDQRTPSSSSAHLPFLASKRFFSPSRMVLLIVSACPLHCGYLGVDLLSRIFHFSQNASNRVEIN